MLEAALTRSGYLATLEQSNDPQDETRVENLAELVAVAREFVVGAGTMSDEEAGAEADDLTRGSLAAFLEQVSLVADADSVPDEGDGVVTLMTLHTAKGLEFPVVFLTGLEDGVFPHMRSLGDSAELEEERRLAYVGITRARTRLYVTRATAGPHGVRRRTTRRRASSTSCPTTCSTGAARPRPPTQWTPAVRPRRQASVRPRWPRVPHARGRSRRSTRATASATTASAWAP